MKADTEDLMISAAPRVKSGSLVSRLFAPEHRFMWLVFAAGLILRIPQITASFYGDEHFSLLRDSTYFLTPTEDRFRPVFFSLLYLWRCLGFESEIGLRLLPLFFGVAQIPVAWFVGKRLGGERLARVFSILIAASPMLIEFSQELRMYSMVAFLALLQALAFLRLIERSNLGRWLVFVLIALLGVYTHLHYWIFLVGVGLAFLVERQKKPLLEGWGALAAVVLLYLPNIPNIQRFAAVRGGDYAVHLPSALPKLIAAFTLGFNYIEFEKEAAGRPVGMSDALHNLPVMLLAAIPLVLILWGLIRAHLQKSETRTLLLCHALFTVPILLAFIVCAVTKQYWLQPKYVIFSAPFALLFVAGAYLALPSVLMRRVTAVLGMAVCIIALVHFWTPTKYGRREDWRGAAEMLKSRIAPDSRLVLLGKAYSYGLLNYYWPEIREKWNLIDVPEGMTKPRLREVEGAMSDLVRSQLHLRGEEDVYYLWSDIRHNESDPNDMLLKGIKELSGNQNVEVTQFNPRFKLYHIRVVPQSRLG